MPGEYEKIRCACRCDPGEWVGRQQLPDALVPRLRRALSLLDEARVPGDLAVRPGYRLHPLMGDIAGLWSVRAPGNWRVVFRPEDNEAVDADLVDYH